MFGSKRFAILVLLALVLATLVPLPAAAQPAAAPQAAAAFMPAAATVSYIVQPGDTMSRIAARFGTSVSAILAANPQVGNANRIYVGQRLQIPVAGGTPGVQRISFAAGTTSATKDDSVARGATKRYVFRASAGQVALIDVFANGGMAEMAVVGANGRVVLGYAAAVTSFRAPLPTSQDYFIEVRGAGGSAISYTLQLIIPERIRFAPGAVSGSVTGFAPHFGSHHYILRAAAGQLMTVDLQAVGQAILVIYGNDGSPLVTDHSGTTHFQGRLPLTEDYFIDVRSVGPSAARYQLDVRITY
jgi:LysM repeat protein